MRILGIDVGERSIGLAISDESGSFARAIAGIPRNRWELELPKIIKDYDVQLLVVGLPKTLDNEESPQTKKVLYFIKRMKEITGCEVTEWDERLSSKLAERYLLSADLSRQKRKKVIDRLSAQIILQDYLDFRNQTDYHLKEAEEI